MPHVHFHDLGLIDYQEGWDYQEQLFDTAVQQKIRNRKQPEHFQPTADHLIFCEHPHTYTLGKSGSPENLLMNDAQLEAISARYYKINRGGDITYHGPGQLVGYPILDLDHFFTDIHKYLRYLEEAVIRTLAEYGLQADRYPGYTGVWFDPDDPDRARKICALGVRASRWVTMHGFAFNINTDLSYFDHIIPCGIEDKAVTSLAAELGQPVEMAPVKQRLMHHLSELFEMQLHDEMA